MADFIPAWIMHGAAITVIVFTALPGLLRGIGRCYYRYTTFGSGESLEPSLGEERYRDYYAQLLELGFRPLGFFRERVLGRCGQPERAFCHSDGHRVAFYYLGGTACVAMSTEFESGTVVRTFNYPGDEKDFDSYIVRRVPTHSIKRLLDAHRHACFRFLNNGEAALPCDTIEDFGQREHDIFRHPILQSEFRSVEQTVLAISLLSLFLMSAAAAGVLVRLIPVNFVYAFSLSVVSLRAIGWLISNLYARATLAELRSAKSPAPASLD